MARTDGLWILSSDGTYAELPDGGYNVLINGQNRYLNFGTVSGSNGYGFRDNNGTMEFKNSGGTWATFGGGGGGGVTSLNTLTGALTLAAGANISITPSGGNTLTIASTGGTSSPLTTKGDLYTYSTTNTRLPVGTNTMVLMADSTQATGIKWANVVTSLNGSTGSFNLGNSIAGTTPTWSSTTLQIPLASTSGVTAGLISKTNFDTFNGKQDALVSGTNIKTINGNSLLGSGNLTIAGSGTVTSIVAGTGLGGGTITTSGTITNNLSTGVSGGQAAYGSTTTNGYLNLYSSTDQTGPINLLSAWVGMSENQKLIWDTSEDGFSYTVSDWAGNYGASMNMFYGSALNHHFGSGEDPVNTMSFVGINIDPEYSLDVQSYLSPYVARFGQRDTNFMQFLATDEGLSAGYAAQAGSLGTDGNQLWLKYGGGDNEWGQLPVEVDSLYRSPNTASSSLWVGNDAYAPLRVYDTLLAYGIFLDSGGNYGTGVVGVFNSNGDIIALNTIDDHTFSFAEDSILVDSDQSIRLNNLSSSSDMTVYADSGGTLRIKGLIGQFTTNQYATPTTGSTVVSDGSPQLILNPAGTIATLVVTFPASPSDGQLFTISSTQAITSLTATGSNALGITGLLANGFGSWVYSGTLAIWVKNG